MYTIIDIETTGGNFKNGRITEIAIYLHDGKKVVDEFVSLVNPEQFIPTHITQLTGISNDMVKNAPCFFEIARKVVEITEGSIFVAHNAAFDYGFVKAEFEALGFKFDRETLCTVKLSRTFLPGRKSYSLGNLCAELNINNNARHRASGDALATVALFEILLNKNNGIIIPLENSKCFSAIGLHPDLDMEKVMNLPQKVGIYYFYNEKGDLIYIGKSNNIRQHILNQIGNPKTQKGVKIKSEMAAVDYELTGSELVALLKESAELKQEKPIYNKGVRKNTFYFGLYSFKDRKGFIRFNIAKNDGRITPLSFFDSLKEANDFLLGRVEEYNLCQKLCGMSDSLCSCFQYQVKICKGACVDAESPINYNKRAQNLIDYLLFDSDDMVIVDKGRDLDENTLIVIKNGKYLGYGWVNAECSFSSIDDIISCIKINEDNQDARMIIKRHLRENKKLKVHKF